MPVELLYFDVWSVHTAAAVRLRLTQDALAIERGIPLSSNSAVGNQQSPATMRQETRTTEDELGEESFGFEVLEKELQQGLESAYSQSLSNFNFSTHENSNPSGMLRSKSQPDPQSQSSAHDTERLAPLRLKKLQKQEAMRDTKALGNFDGGFGRATPRCLRPGESQHESTGSLAAIEELRRELMVANEGLQHLDSMVAENIQWVHANCDVKGVLEKKGQTLSHRAVSQCRRMAAERLSDVLESYVLVSLKNAFGRLKQAVKLSTIANTSKNYVRGKCIEITTNILAVALRRQYKKMFEPWVLRVRWETRWEQEAATVEIQRVARAYLAKCRVFHIICDLKSVIMQCCVRVFLAKCRVARVKRAREIHFAATALKYFVRGRVLMKMAKARVQLLREARAALKIQSVFRGFQGREKVRAVRAHIALRNHSASIIQNRIYRAKIQSYYAVMERKKCLEMERIERERQAMQAEALREDAATKIQAQARRISAVKRVAAKRSAYNTKMHAGTLQKYFKLRVATRVDRDNLKIRRNRHNAAIKIQSIGRMRLGQRKMDRRRDDASRGIMLQSDPSYDEDDPAVELAAIKMQSLTRGVLARQKAKEKKSEKKKNKLRLKGHQKKDTKEPKPPNASSLKSSARILSTRDSMEDKQKNDVKSPPSSRQHSGRISGQKIDQPPKSSNSSVRKPDIDKSSRPTSGRSSKSPSRPTSGASFRSMLSRGLSSIPNSVRGKNVTAEEEEEEVETKEVEKEKEVSVIFNKSGKNTPKGTPSAASSANASRNSSAGKRKDPDADKDATGSTGGDIKKPMPLQPKTPSRSVEELDSKREEDPTEKSLKEGKQEEKLEKAKEVKAKPEAQSRPSSSSSGKSSRPPSRPGSRPSSAMKNTPPPQLQDSKESSRRVVDESEVDEKERQEDLEQAQREVGGGLDVKEETEKPQEEQQEQQEEQEEQEQEKMDSKEDDVKEKEKDTVEKTPEPEITPPDSFKQEENRGRPLSKQSSQRAQSPSFLRQASGKIFGRSQSTTTPSTPKSKSPSRAHSPMVRLKSMFSQSFRGSPGLKRDKNRVYKPKDRTLIPRSDDDAAIRMQSIARQKLGHKLLKAKKKEIRNLQKKAGLIVLWAIVTIQRVIRGRIGRWRWTRFYTEHKEMLQKEENARIWKELEEEELAEKKAAAEKERLAEELEDKNNAMWSQYGKPKPKEEGDGHEMDTSHPSNRVIPPPTSAPPPLQDTQPLQSNAAVAELDERMRRLEEMEKTMIEKEERMIEAANRAEVKAAEMQRAIDAMEKRAAEEEAEKQVRKSMMELAAGPMSSMGSQFSTGPVRSSRPSARGPMASSRSQGPNSSRPPPTARSAKDGTPRPKEVLKVHVQGVEWCQLWDADENAWYWYCEATAAAQWDQPNEYGYESTGAMTDYSTENDGWNTESGSQWQEYWDEQAQAKYWYNTTTGEASWTPPSDSTAGGSVGGGSIQGPAGDDWVSYVDEATSEEYWYNTKTGETSWST